MTQKVLRLRLTKNIRECLAHDPAGFFDLLGLVSGGNESSLELRGSEVDAGLKTVVKEAREPGDVAPFCGAEVRHGARGKDEAKHRADAMEAGFRFGFA